MRQGQALVRGALIATASVAAPVAGPVAAHAIALPGVSVTVGDTHVSVGGSTSVANVSVGGANVTVPNVTQQSGPLPAPPALPDPAGTIVGGITNTGNNTIHQALPPSSSSPSGGSTGGPAAGSGGGGSSGSSGSGGSGSKPHANTRGGPTPGSTPGGPTPSTPRARARAGARRAARRRATAPGTTPVSSRTGGAGGIPVNPASGPKKNDGGSSNPVASAIRRIEQVIPGPLWGVIGLLALLAGGFALRSRIVTRRAKRLERQREELLGDVGLLQRALLPDVPTGLSGIDVSVAYRPAEGPAAGGDFYDVFELDDDRTAIIVGDVCGHGRQALAVTALMRYTLRAYLGAGFEPRVALQVAGRTIEGDPDSELTTVVLAVYDARAGTLTYACAGHEPPIVLGPGAHDPVTVSSAPPIGGFMATGHRQTTVPLPPGSAACFFTDGLVEARLGDKMMGRGRLTELVTELAPGEGAQLLLERLAATADRAPDDMAACLVRARGDAVDARGVRLEELETDAEELKGDRVLAFLTACGIPEASAEETLGAARAKAAEFGGALLRVHASGKGGRVEILPTEVAALPVPTLAADARRRAALQISA
jgi:serine phosphatase RsbU (regulator of sigma subunit)